MVGAGGRDQSLVVEVMTRLHAVGGLLGYEEDVVGLEVAVEDVARVQVLHAGGGLLGDVDQMVHLPVLVLDVQVPIERRARTPLGHDGQVGLEYAADEEQNVVVPGRLEDCDLVAEGVRLVERRILHVQEFDGHLVVVEVATAMHYAERARAHLAVHVDFDLTARYLPRVERVASARSVLFIGK